MQPMFLFPLYRNWALCVTCLSIFSRNTDQSSVIYCYIKGNVVYMFIYSLFSGLQIKLTGKVYVHWEYIDVKICTESECAFSPDSKRKKKLVSVDGCSFPHVGISMVVIEGIGENLQKLSCFLAFDFCRFTLYTWLCAVATFVCVYLLQTLVLWHWLKNGWNHWVKYDRWFWAQLLPTLMVR